MKKWSLLHKTNHHFAKSFKDHLLFQYNKGKSWQRTCLLEPKYLKSTQGFTLVYNSISSPSSKYKHRRTSALLRTRNIRICMGKKKPILSVTYENERISIKNSLAFTKCVLRHSRVVYGPIYGRFMGCTVNGFLSVFIEYNFTVQLYGTWTTQERRNTHLVKAKLHVFFIEILSFQYVTETIGLFPYKSLYFECYATLPMFADVVETYLIYFQLGLPVIIDMQPVTLFRFSLKIIYQFKRLKWALSSMPNF